MTESQKVKNRKVTLCMIVKNEEVLIEECLKSAALHVDEIVIVDTGSTDRTMELIRQSGVVEKVNLFHHPWNDDFAEARNVSLSHAKGDWVLILDADERIAEKDWSLIRSSINTDELIGYSMTTRNYGQLRNMPGWRLCTGEYPGMEADYPGWYPTSKVRLFPNHKDIFFRYRVHELVEESVLAQGSCIKPCRVVVHHIESTNSVEDPHKEEYYLALVRKKIEEHHDDPLPYFEAGVISYGLKRLEEAYEYFKQSLEILRKKEAIYLRHETVLWEIGMVAADMGMPEEAAKYYEEALRENPRCIEALNNWGVLLEKYHRYQEAAEKYRQALSIDSQNHLLQENIQRVEEKVVSPQARLSLCMIVRNEEKNIGPCIEGIKNVVDEIIVVDTGSSDSTSQIAENYGAKVFSFPWTDDFSAARNESIRHATGDYIVWLDADDRLTHNEAGKLLQLKRILPSEKDKAYLLKLVNLRENTELDVCWQLRIFPNRGGIIFQNKIHETVFSSLERLGIELINADIRIHHTGYSGEEVCLSKARRNITLMKQELKEDPNNFMLWYLIGGAYALIGNHSNAMSSYKKVIQESGWEKTNPSVYANTLLQIGKIHHAYGEYGEALEFYTRAMRFLPDDALVWFVIGESLFARGEYHQALDAFERVRDENIQIGVLTIPVFKIRYLQHFYRGRCYLEMGNTEQAINALYKTLNIYPEFIDALKLLSLIYLRRGQWAEAEELLEKVIKTDRGDPTVLSNLGLIYSKGGRVEKAERFYKEALKLDPDCAEALINLGHLYFNRGRYKEAQETMEKVVAIDSSPIDTWLVLARIYAGNREIDSFLHASDHIIRLIGLKHFHIESFEDLSKVYIKISETLMEQERSSLVPLACNIAECMLQYHQQVLK